MMSEKGVMGEKSKRKSKEPQKADSKSSRRKFLFAAVVFHFHLHYREEILQNILQKSLLLEKERDMK